jgi:serine/threonine protein kinase
MVMEESPPAFEVLKVGPYRVLDVIGEGGMGVVYRAAHESNGEVVALKAVRLPVTSMLASIRREVYALQRLRHPGVVRIVDQGVDPALGPWYAMELLGGASLRQRLCEWFPGGLDDEAPPPRRSVSPERLIEVLTLFRRVCGALAYVHANGIVHRDLKPENVHLASELRTVLVDFGLASQFGAKEVAMQVQNRGSLHYMSPEQIALGNVDARADLYALGCMLHECLAGSPPFRGPARNLLIAQHLHVVPAPVSEHVGGIPPELDQLVARLLQKRPGDRFGYAADVARALASMATTSPRAPR